MKQSVHHVRKVIPCLRDYVQNKIAIQFHYFAQNAKEEFAHNVKKVNTLKMENVSLGLVCSAILLQENITLTVMLGTLGVLPLPQNKDRSSMEVFYRFVCL